MAVGQDIAELPSLNGRQSFLMQQHAHVLDSIKFADQKATGIAAISTGLIYCLLGVVLKDVPHGEWVWRGPALFVATVLLGGFLLAVLVLFPQAHRFDPTTCGGKLALPQYIATMGRDEFAKQVAALTSHELTEHLVTLVHQRCLIREVKYKYLKKAFFVSGAGYVFAIVLVACHVMR